MWSYVTVSENRDRLIRTCAVFAGRVSNLFWIKIDEEPHKENLLNWIAQHYGMRNTSLITVGGSTYTLQRYIDHYLTRDLILGEPYPSGSE
jgi:hypothetical protein